MHNSSSIPIKKILAPSTLVNDGLGELLSEELYSGGTDFNHPIVIILDLSDVTYIDIVSCVYLISFARQCGSNYWYLAIKIPRSGRVLDFWKTWGFYQAFEDTVGQNLGTYLSNSDEQRIEKKQNSFDASGVLRIADASRKQKWRASFGLSAEKITSPGSPSLADSLARNWRRQEVQDVLGYHFGRNGSYFPANIIFETIYNSTKHAGAQNLMTAAISRELCRTKSQKEWIRDKLFTLTIWDDGNSLLDTFRLAVEEGRNVRENVGSYDQEFLLDCRNLNDAETFNEEHVSSNMNISKAASHEQLLLSTLFAGTTSKPASEHHSLAEGDSTHALRGMGLFVLLNTVIDVLKGQVSFRTSRYFMHVRSPRLAELKKLGITGEEFRKNPERYKKVKIVKYPDEMPEFFGNLVLIRA